MGSISQEHPQPASEVQAAITSASRMASPISVQEEEHVILQSLFEPLASMQEVHVGPRKQQQEEEEAVLERDRWPPVGIKTKHYTLISLEYLELCRQQAAGFVSYE